MRRALIFVSMVIVIGQAVAAPAAQYSLTGLGVLGGMPTTGGSGAVASAAYGINDLGQVVGYSTSPTMYSEAFIWNPVGGMTGIGDLPGGISYSAATGINNAGKVVGYAYSSNGREAFRWRNGTMIGLGDLPGGDFSSYASGINDVGQIAGYGTSSAGYQAFRWRRRRFTILNPNAISYANGINNRGRIVGEFEVGELGCKAFCWNGWRMRALPALPGATEVLSFAKAINSLGQIVGYSDFGEGMYVYEATLWQGGTVTGLGFLPGCAMSEAYDINDSGVVVGYSRSYSSGPESGAFVWQSSTGMALLDSLLDASGAGWHLTRAYGINNAGQIVGQGRNPQGYYEAFLLTPIP